ncbi:MAG: hypothetical protein GY801_02235, partial [bacterium]|nr:hypothetical protein [bacterium]
TYDTVGNILSKQTERGSYNYTYDAISRLTDVQVDVPGEDNEGFDYDAVGNRVAQEGVEGEWSYNDNNELLTFADTEYRYDENGNAVQLLLDDAVMFRYHYNAQDRLIKVEDVNGSMIAEYAYDPFGRRLWKEVSGSRAYFFYADEGLVAEYDASGNEIRAYGYKPNSTWSTDPLWLKEDGEYYFYHNDHLGTPQKLVKMNGAIVWSASYTAFGQARVEVETVTNNLRFPGQYFDAETELHYNFNRYYTSGESRYLKKDPIGFQGRDTHLYRYALNNPVRFFDPDGFNPYDTFFASCRNLMGGNNPINRELNQWERRFPRQKAKRVLPPALFLSMEAHIVVTTDKLSTSAGLTYLSCCTSVNHAQIYVYKKKCRGGVAVTAGFGGGAASKMMGENCVPAQYTGWFLELAFGPVGIDVGFTQDETTGYLKRPSGVNEISLNLGVGIKFTYCYYTYLYKMECPFCQCKI